MPFRERNAPESKPRIIIIMTARKDMGVEHNKGVPWARRSEVLYAMWVRFAWGGILCYLIERGQTNNITTTSCRRLMMPGRNHSSISPQLSATVLIYIASRRSTTQFEIHCVYAVSLYLSLSDKVHFVDDECIRYMYICECPLWGRGYSSDAISAKAALCWVLWP